jgi:glucose-6-phosphate dehydrogenase assembly protein OpcA
MSSLESDSILQELSELWASLGEAGNDESGSVVRACALTLAVFAEQSDDAAGIGETLAQVMREHPNRAILVRVRSGGEPFLEHRVLSQCWMPFGRREQVCCERIEITASDASLVALAPVLVALRVPDLPMALWYRSARLFEQAALDPALIRADKVIVDSEVMQSSQTLERLAAMGAPPADLAWTRLTRWRAIIAGVFESPRCRGLLPRLAEIRVFYSGGRVPEQAVYLAAWILDALGREIEVSFDPVPGGAGGLEGIELSAGERENVSVRRSGDAVLVEAGGARSCAGLPRLSESELLASELAISGRDAVFERSLLRAVRLGGRQDIG